MAILRIAFLIGLVFLGGASVLVGGAVLASSLATGVVMVSYVQNGQPVAETVRRSEQAARYWQLVGGIGAAPLVLGALAAWFGISRLRR